MTRMTRMARTVARMARWLADLADPSVSTADFGKVSGQICWKMIDFALN